MRHPPSPTACAAALGSTLAATTATAFALAVRRDMRRARRAARLEPPVTRIDVRVDPPGIASSAYPIRLAALGDSSVAGVGAEGLYGCLAVQIAARVAAATRQPVHVRGYGVSGARTADVTTMQVQALDVADPPDAIVVVVGTNDVAHATPPWRYIRDVARLHRSLRERLGAAIVYCSLPEFRAITVISGPLRVLAVGYGRLLGGLQRRTLAARSGAWWVDARREAGPAFLRRPDAMSADRYHPSALGYALLADTLAPAVVAALASRRGRP